MKFTDLDLFCTVVETGGMTQAAAAKGLSQPGISRVIRDLENRQKVTLLKRTGRGVELTPSGELFYRFAKEALMRLEQTQTEMRALSGTYPSRFSLAIPRQTSRAIAPAIYKAFSNELPDIELQMSESQSATMSAKMAQQEIDAALFYSNSPARFDDSTLLFSEQLWLIGPKEHIGEGHDPIELTECARLPLLMYSNAVYQAFVMAAFASATLTPTIVKQVSNPVALIAYAMEGEGVAVLPYSNIMREVEAREIYARPIGTPAIERKVCLALAPHLDRAFSKTVFQILKAALKSCAPQVRWQAIHQ